MLVLRDGRMVQSGSPRKIFEQPANVEVARLLGLFNLMPVEIRTLDPGRNASRLIGEFELDGPYFPGKLKGDRVTVCVRPDQLKAAPRNGVSVPNQIPAELKRAVEKSQSVRLEFSGGIDVEMPRAEYESQRETEQWAVEFPRESLRVL